MKRVLIVEDDRAQSVLYEKEFRSDGYEVVTAGDGKEALIIMESHPVDLVITDIRMPHMSGFDFLSAIVSRFAGMPIIIYTAYDHYQNNYLTWGADAYLVKSSDLTPLKQKAAELLAAR
jgi:DNA-binding response OmpR family regulator